MSLQLDAELFGVNPARFHLTNLLLHSANVLLLYWVLVSLTGARWPAAASAALFAVHPLNVETVAWVSERKGLLSMFFGLLAVGAYSAHARSPGRGRYALVLIAYSLSLLAKPVFVTLPVLLLLLDYWPLRRAGAAGPGGRTWRELVWGKMPLFAVAIAAGVMTIRAEEQSGALSSLSNKSTYSRVTNGVVSYAEYLRKVVYPDDLAPFYPHPGLALPGRAVVVSALTLGCLTVLAWRARRGAPYLFVGWAWFVVAFIPMSGLIQVGAHAMADRYTYLPVIGLFVAACWGVRDLAGRAGWAPIVIAVVAVGSAVLVTRVQVRHWETSEALWEHTLSVTSRNHRAHFHLAKLLAERGKADEAISHFKAGLEFHPRDELANYFLGCLLGERGRLDEAVVYLGRATEAAPRFSDAWWQLGRVERRRNNPSAALVAFSNVLELNKDHPLALAERGTVLARMGRPQEAVADLRAARAAGNESPDVDNNLGIALAELGRFDEARASFESAIRTAPASPDGLINLGILAERTGRPDEAVAAFQAAVRLDAKNVATRSGLGILFRRLGRTQDAAVQLEAATALSPNDPELWHELGLVWEIGGKPDRAAGAYRRATQLRPNAPDDRLLLGSVLADLGRPEAAAEFRAAQVYPNNVRQIVQSIMRLAADPDPGVREEKVAVCLARAASRGSGGNDPQLLEVLAVAYAADGQYARAVEEVQRALGLTTPDRADDHRRRERLLKTFREGTPFRNTR